MQLIQWDNRLDSGIELMDSQHKKLFKTANSFMIKCKYKQYREAAEQVLSFFEQYVQYHFQAEEAFQRELKYSEADSHQSSHNMLTIKFKMISLEIRESDYLQDDVEKFYVFIMKWITEHILNEDMAFSQYINQNPELAEKFINL